jgi:ligand-binding sensor domain-containing protein/signal transduction histidine kinase
MGYTLDMSRSMRLIFFRLLGGFLMLALASCGVGNPPPATPKADSAANSLPEVPSRIPAASIPEVCNCILRFDNLGIEDGLSQSTVRVIFQDSLGFLWFGTEDGLNRYDGYSFKVFKPEPNNPYSISSGWITAIIEDQNGRLWIGTHLAGLNQYDPFTRRFTQYNHDPRNPTSLIDDHIRALWVDGENQLWVGTTGGLDRFDPRTGIFYHYPFATPSSPLSDAVTQDPLLDADRVNDYPGISTVSKKLSSGSITALFQDSRGKMWVGTADGGLNVFDPKKNIFTIYRHIENEPATINSDRITALTEDSQGNIWVATHEGFSRFQIRTGIFEQFTADRSDPLSLSDNIINALLFDSNDNLWVATSNGLNRLSKDGTHFIRYYNDSSFSKSLSDNHVLSIYEDRGGVLWFGTLGSGVNKYDWGRSRFTYYRHDPNNPNSLSGNFITPVHVDHEGVAWIGINGNGLNRLNWQTGEIATYLNNPGTSNSLGSNWVTAIAEDQENLLWIGTNAGLDRFDPVRNLFSHYRYDPSNPLGISANSISALYVDRNNSLWIGTSSGLDLLDRETGTFIHFIPDAGDPTRLSGARPFVIREDTDGYLWIGTSESGLNRYDPLTGTFRQFRHNPKDEKSISSDAILSIYQDSRKRIWIGTAGGGLNLYHPDSDTFTYYLESDGLPNGFVYGILEDNQGRLWLSTNFGISRFDPEAETFRNFDSSDGLQSNEFNPGAYAKGHQGEFYFGGINGLTVFDPSKITDNPYPPQVALISLTQDNQPIPTNSSVETVRQVTLQWPHNSLEFEFAALGYNQPSKNEYAYFLEGFDSNWHYIGTQRDGRYTNLPGGKYTLLLKASNNDGVWSEESARILITVIPPFWQTTPFRVAVALAIAAIAVVGIRVRTKAIQDRNWQLERLVRERTSALEKRNQEIQALYQADERILRNVSLHQVFQTLVDVAVDTLNADRSVVFAWDEQRKKVMPLVSRGFTPETLKVLEFAKGEGIVGRVLNDGQPAFIRQIEWNEFRQDVREALMAEGIRSFVHLPIIVDQKIVGVFNIGFTRPSLISDDAARLFSALTHRASISIANMQLFEQTKDLAVMEERNRLARDLHDSAKQKAFAALAQLGAARGLLNGNGSEVTNHLAEAENLVSDVIQELTFLVQEIYPIALQEKGLATVLREYVFEWETRNDTAVHLSIQNERRLPLGVEQALYRVTQEALANVARHSRAKNVQIALAYNGDGVQLCVSDDGCGFDVEAKGHGLGLRSIRERISSVHGTTQIQSAPGRGTTILVQAPINT